MQYYLDGFYPGDPENPPHVTTPPTEIPDEIDVLIIGAGPAGLVLATQLAQFPQISTRLVESKPGPLQLGQADGVSCRSVEMFKAFGLSEQLLKESYWVNETTFWSSQPDNPALIERTGRVQDTADDLSEFPHVIVNQARIHDYLLSSMRKSAVGIEPDYAWQLQTLTVDHTRSHPVEAVLKRTTGSATKRVRARYLVGCDGARSTVRKSLGIRLEGDAADHAWGVMDILAKTNFPDIRYKSVIQSMDAGNILLIPREGGYLIRLYVDLGAVTEKTRPAIKSMGPDQIAEVARRVLHPYTLDIFEVVWSSVYEVAQRLSPQFDNRTSSSRPHVFIAGDACHTHSAKAGQGMNVSMQDAFNLGWKLAAVITGKSPESLLKTYSDERQPVAKELIDFDREWSSIVSARSGDDSSAAEADRQEYFTRSGEFTAGVATCYPPSTLTTTKDYQHLAQRLQIGTRFHSAPVTRAADARVMELGHCAEADGRWRIYIFADSSEVRFQRLCKELSSQGSPIFRYTPAGADLDAVFDIRAVLQSSHSEIDLGSLPSLVRPEKGKYGLPDHEKVYSSQVRGLRDFFDVREIDREMGCLILVRPDQYISTVLPLKGTTALGDFLSGIFQ